MNRSCRESSAHFFYRGTDFGPVGRTDRSESPVHEAQNLFRKEHRGIRRSGFGLTECLGVRLKPDPREGRSRLSKQTISAAGEMQAGAATGRGRKIGGVSVCTGSHVTPIWGRDRQPWGIRFQARRRRVRADFHFLGLNPAATVGAGGSIGRRGWPWGSDLSPDTSRSWGRGVSRIADLRASRLEGFRRGGEAQVSGESPLAVPGIPALPCPVASPSGSGCVHLRLLSYGNTWCGRECFTWPRISRLFSVAKLAGIPGPASFDPAARPAASGPPCSLLYQTYSFLPAKSDTAGRKNPWLGRYHAGFLDADRIWRRLANAKRGR